MPAGIPDHNTRELADCRRSVHNRRPGAPPLLGTIMACTNGPHVWYQTRPLPLCHPCCPLSRMCGVSKPTCCRVEQQAESGVRWGNKYRPTPKWKRLLRSLRESWRGSLGQLLLQEFGSLLGHIRERSRNRKPVFAFGIPPCPPCLCEFEGFGWCDCLRPCTRNPTRLRKENPWIELRDVHMAVQSWIAGTDCGVRVYSELRCKESPFRSSSPAAVAILCRP